MLNAWKSRISGTHPHLPHALDHSRAGYSPARALRRPRTARHAGAARLLAILLVATVVAPGLALQSNVPVARADNVSDAIAAQQRLAKLIAAQKAQLAGLSAQQTALSSQIAATAQGLAGVRDSIDVMQGQISALGSQLDAVSSAYATVLVQETTLRQQQAEIGARAAAAQILLRQRQAILAARIAAAYEADRQPLLEQILTAHSLTEALSDVSAYTDFAAADKALAEQIRADKTTVDQLLAQVNTAAQALATFTAQVAAQRKQLDDQKTQLLLAQTSLDDLRTKLETQLADQQAAQAKLEADKTALAAAIVANGQALDQLGTKVDRLIAQELAAGRIPSQWSGTMVWPMGGMITQQFGCTGVLSEPRVGNCAHFHQGIDIAAPCNTPVHAAAAGEVVFVGYNPYDAAPQAWLVIIAHSATTVTWYAHMTAKAPSGIYVGAHVAAGQLVGTENTTGRSSGCHLHWAVRVNGTFVNPRLFV
jgi:murein DD-endopeptidase MepM/ murein hydrolase activator NlpD